MKVFVGFLLGVAITLLGLLAIPIALDAGLQPSCPTCASAQYDISAINTALDIYGLDHGIYPTIEQGLGEIIKLNILKKIPNDPWGKPYYYFSYRIKNHVCYIVWSFGSDGVPGGEDEHAQDVYYESPAGNCLIRQDNVHS